MDWLTPSFLATLASNPDVYGHVFYMTIFAGTRLIATHNKLGWVLRVLGDIGWIGLGYYLGLTSIMFWSSIFALNDGYGYYKWKNYVHAVKK